MASQVSIRFEPDGKRVRAESGDTVRDAAEKAGVGLRSECGGERSCGKCRVIIQDQSNLCEVSKDEAMHLTSEDISAGYRLACFCVAKSGNFVVFVPSESKIGTRQIQIEGVERPVKLNPAVEKFQVSLSKPSIRDVEPDFERLMDALLRKGFAHLEIDHELLEVLPRTLRDANWNVTVAIWNSRRIISVEKGNTKECIYGFSVDIGTSKIVGYLINLVSGRAVAAKALENPQMLHGEDIISRINYATTCNESLKELKKITIQAINALILDCCNEAGINSEDIYEITIVGNTAMHHFFLGIQPDFLATGPFVPAVKKTLDLKANSLGVRANALANVHVLPIVAGYVGADAVADILATGINKTKDKCLLIDVGTNGEVFVGNREDIVSCSCAAGPAFEGMHIQFGMKARTGAIERLRIAPDTYEVEYETIGSVKPVGICGSGIIDAIAEMFKCGLVNQRGFNKNVQTKRLIDDNGEIKFVVAWRSETGLNNDITISGKDVQEIQLAKAAIHAGTMVLMEEMKLKESDLDRVLIAGAFGKHLNPESAKFTGLIPDISNRKVTFVGNTAISGAKMALLSKTVRKEAEGLSRSIRYVELMVKPGFRKEFVNSMFLPYRDMSKYPSVCEFFKRKIEAYPEKSLS